MNPLHAALILAATTSAQAALSSFVHVNGNATIPPFNDTAFSSAPVNASREVAFDRSLGHGGGNWTWTLSISEVQLPNSSEYTTIPNARIAYTKYGFKWPDGGSVNQAVGSSDLQCMYNIWTDLPQEIANAWDSTSSSCASALGQNAKELSWRE